jgi:phosphotransferase system enzyme I (PtsI)
VLPRQHETEVPRYAVSETEVADELTRFENALLRTRTQIHGIQNRIRQAMGTSDAAIFDAQLLMLDDPVLLEEVASFVRRERTNVEHAFAAASARYLAVLSGIDDEYLRERVADMRDVTTRIMRNLLNHDEPADLSRITEPCILVAYDLTPSQTAVLDQRMVLGFATDQGSKTSHTAILARSLGLPAVTGLCDATQRLKAGQYALLDGYNGLLITDPTEQTLYEYGQLDRRHLAVQERLHEIRDLPAVTLDGTRVILSANVEKPEETPDVQGSGAEGVGLFRTEYLFLNRDTFPGEEEQFQAYHQVAAALKPQPVIIRTLDLGGDKFPAHYQAPAEHNPFLGWRAIRICLQERDLFRPQLRAILRASAVGNVKIMYPMISSLEELNQANAMLEQCRQELRAEGQPFNENLETGIMMEIPAAVLIAEALAKRVNFFSIGTNDLIQYSLAVDRMNPKIAHLYEPTHPAVLRLIQTTVAAAHAHGIWVGVCGEMAGDPVLVPLLIGLGADDLSTAPSVLPAVKYLVRHLKLGEARDLARFALQCDSGAEILKRAEGLAQAVAPGLWLNAGTANA